ncbi:hypothetical protein [Azospira sp. I09]|uniref:hypothetical protein n=1 Tax=Azospira sp. I09 TaxID=1765049 RepID=UPI0012608F1B|nr:hypothetical protein [Azospira sp. I09]
MTTPDTCVTAAQIATDTAAAFGPVIEQLILLSWMWAAVFFFLGGVFGPAVAHAVLVVARVVCRRIRRMRAA